MKRFFFLWFLFFSGIVLAGNVTVDQARQIAVSFWQSAPVTRGGVPSLQMVFHSEDLVTRSSVQSPAYYVFDNTGGPGFVIVAGDDVAMPVLGYSFEHEFSKDNLPANLKAWLEYMRDEVNEARRSGIKAQEAVTRAWKSMDAGEVVVKLETAEWSQGEPYNWYCPMINGQKAPTGCVITALAIVMRYHQWPEKGVGVLPGYETGNGITLPEISLGHPYNWANMLLKYPWEGYTQAEAEAVATLMRDLGVMLQAGYGLDGTGAATSNIPSGLITYMGYDKATRWINRDHYSTIEWHQLMKVELNNNRPIIYSGSNDEGGHAFVLDGYTTDNYFSVNWGWGGSCNGYFLLTALDPAGQGVGGSAEGYNNYQGAVIGIQKDTNGKNFIEELRFAKYSGGPGLWVEQEISTGIPFILNALLVNSGSMNFVGDILFALVNKHGNIVEELGIWNVSESDNFYSGSSCLFNMYLTINQKINVGYRIRGYYRSANTPEWTLIKGNEEDGCTWDLLIADEYSIEETTQLTYNKKSRLLRLLVKDGVSVSLRSSGGSDCSDKCQIQGNEITVDTSLLRDGTYSLTLQKGDDRKTLNFSVANAAE